MLVGLITVALIVWGSYLIAQPQEKTQPVRVTKTVKVPVAPSIPRIRKWLLESGVGYAWNDKLPDLGRADCFATVLLADGKSIFSYCKLKHPVQSP